MTIQRVDSPPPDPRMFFSMRTGSPLAASPGCFVRSRAVAPFVLALLTLALIVPLGRCQADGSADLRVQSLYENAKSAEARGDLAVAVANYREILRIAPRLAPAYNNLGALYLKQGRYEQAAQILEQGLKIDSGMISALALSGIAEYNLGRYAAARGHLEAALRANPQDANAESYLASTLMKSGDLEAAAQCLEKITQRDPKNQEALYNLGKVYMQLSQKTLGKLNQIDPNSFFVHEISGEIMESMQNYDGALVEYKKAVEMEPKRPGAHLKLANAYWSLRIWKPAEEQFRAELENDPRSCESHAKLGNILIEGQSDFAGAVEETSKALAICPGLEEAHFDRGRALLKLNRNEEALQDLVAAEKADPSVSSTHFLLAQAYRALGKTAEAKSEMLTFSKLEEEARAASSARMREVLKNKENPN